MDGKCYNLNYDLTDKPTFTFEIPIEKGMSYENFKEQIDNLNLPMIGYIAVANIQGVEFEDSSVYFLMSYLGNALNGSWSTENSYIIYDDTNMSDGVTINKDESDPKTIYASEFGERVMEYVNATYKDKQTIKDSSEGINSYEWTTERKDVTDTSCKLVSSLSVNTNADFSMLNGYNQKMGESFLNEDITNENADYGIVLRVGQICRIESTENITGYEFAGSACKCNKINDKCVEITAKEVGRANGYIYVGNTKKTFFVTVEENVGNSPLATMLLQIDTTSGTDKNDKKQEEKTNDKANNNNNNNKSTDNTLSKTILPKTGVNNIVFIVMLFSLFFIIIFSIKLKKYKDVK